MLRARVHRDPGDFAVLDREEVGDLIDKVGVMRLNLDGNPVAYHHQLPGVRIGATPRIEQFAVEFNDIVSASHTSGWQPIFEWPAHLSTAEQN